MSCERTGLIPKRKLTLPYGRGSVTQWPNGKYQVQLYLGDSGGKKVKKYFTAATVEAAHAWAGQTLQRYRQA